MEVELSEELVRTMDVTAVALKVMGKIMAPFVFVALLLLPVTDSTLAYVVAEAGVSFMAFAMLAIAGWTWARHRELQV